MAAPTRAKKRLGEFLTHLRREAGQSMLQAATELKTTDSTVSRYESGQVLPNWATVNALCAFFKANDDERREAARLWELASDEPARVRLPAGAGKSFRALVQAELEAKLVRTLGMLVVPGLLQTERYVRAVHAAAHRFRDPEARVDSYVAARLNRQKRLEVGELLQLHALIDEAVIERAVGGTDVLREQLEHLLTMGQRDNITIQLVPKSAGAYGTMSGSCSILSYPDLEDPPGLYLEYAAGGAWVEDREDVLRFTTMFEDVTQIALSPSETAARIGLQIGALGGQ